MSSSQPIDPNLAPIGVGKENSPDPNDPDAAPIVDLEESRIEPDPAYQDDVPVGRQTLTKTRGARAAAGKSRTARAIARASLRRGQGSCST
jgi:hypothetical protein